MHFALKAFPNLFEITTILPGSSLNSMDFPILRSINKRWSRGLEKVDNKFKFVHLVLAVKSNQN